jgi:hypothetical protein
MKSIIEKPIFRLSVENKTVKALVTGLGLFFLLNSAQAQVAPPAFTWPVYEPFGEYTNNTFLGSGNTGMATNTWNQGNGAGATSPKVFDIYALSYPALVVDTNPTPKGAVSSTATGSRDCGALFTAHGGQVYASFIISDFNNQGTLFDRMFFSLQTSTSLSSGFGMSIYFTTDYRLRIRKNPSGNPSGTFSNPTQPLTTNAPHLIVLRYLTNSVSGAPGRVDLWVDPAPFGDNASIPPPTLSTTNGANVNTFDMVGMTSRGTGLYTYYIDEIRVGDTWAGVTPLQTPVPGPMFGVSGGGTGCSGDTFPVTLSGSVATNDYWLYTNAVYAGVTQTGTGSALTFGPYSNVASYSILASNNVNGNIGWMSNSVTIYVRASAMITNEPVAVITATNSRAQFSVAASGDDLVYVWYKDGNPLTDTTNISGSSTPTLVVWPATASDVGNYKCSVTNVCSSSMLYSSTVSLTLDSPANLVYYGDPTTTPPAAGAWDINFSYNWNGAAAIFNEGDNVTFDDTYNTSFGTIVPLVGTLTPTHMVYSTANSLTWGGNGFITGTADLLVSGAGRLVISNTSAPTIFLDNPFSGGTVISNGTVFIQSPNGLGSGPITLSGGTFETLGKLTFTNVINVTTNSKIQLDQSGQQAITLAGSFTSTSGTILTLTNSSALTNSQNWVVFTGALTNNSTIVLASAGTNSSQRLSVNDSTNIVQIYNGPISEYSFGTNAVFQTNGVGGVIKNGVGSLYLNATNTYTLGTTNLNGLLAGSGVISGPVSVFTNGIIGAGTPNAIGKLTISNNITFIGGNIFTRVNKSISPSNDLIVATGFITNSLVGPVSLTITNIGGLSIAVGDAFNIFSAPVLNGAAITVSGGGVSWQNNLAVDGSVIALNPADVSAQITGPAGSVVLGNNYNYTLTFSNSGPGIATGVAATDTLSSKETFVSATSGGVTNATANPRFVTWGAFTLAANTATNFTVTVNAASAGNATNITSASTSSFDPNANNNSATNVAIIISTIIPNISAGITSFNLSGANVLVNATNGVNGGTYYLLQSTNMASPLNQWLVVATNVINTNGAGGAFTFTGTNVVTPNGAQQFYILSNTNNH